MEQSFSEYRDKTGVESESDSEVIDNSMVLEDSFSWKKKLVGRSRIVSESEESTDGDSEGENVKPNIPKSVLRRSSLAEAYVISSSEDDASKRGSACRPSEMSFNKVILSSSEEEEVSPEILPKRRPPMRPKSTESSNSSMIGRKKNKRMILMDSDTENSIVIEHDKHKKIACLKDTPLKIDDGPTKAEFRKATLNDSTVNQSMDETNRSNDEESQSSDEEDESDDEEGHSDDEDGQSCDESGNKEQKTDDKGVASDNDDKKDQFDDTKGQTDDENAQNCDRQSLNDCENDDENAQQSHSDDTEAQSNDVIEESDDGPDEDQMILSRATRMSIMGVIPKGNDTDSDESDFIQSDENSRGSSSTNSLSELPDSGISVLKTPQKPAEPDTSRISCSPIESPLRDITKQFNLPKQDRKSNLDKKPLDDDVTFVDTKNLKQNIMQNFANIKSRKENVVDDDVTIIDSKPEIIALSSDDEEDIPKRSPVIKTSPKPKGESTSRRSKDGTLKPFLPGSYPNQVVYVKRHVRENELNKLERLKEDLHNVKYLLESMDVSTLPDGGVKLMQRLSGLEQQVRQQGDKVASMVLEPDMPSDKDVSRDGFDAKDKALSWDDIQQASNAVQPRMFGKQAMATHMAERNLILERLRDLHASLASRPPESQLAPSPPAVRAQLMPHQLHALAWLRWRETQRPVGGILADDMGLGKTITMIALVVGDKDNGIADDDDNDDEYTGKSSSKLARGGTLVVCPASLIQQWGGEVGKHCVSHAARVCLHHGAARATHPHRIATQDIVVTTYNILQRDHEKNGVLMKILWRRVILDEAHIVRNHKSATSAAVSALRGVRRWCLTGTPVQNKDLDLFALLKFLRCTPFDELTMWKKWIDNKSSGGQERLSTIMRCILLRRTKVQLQQKGQLDCLPERTAHLQEVTLSKEEMNVYQKVLVFSKTLFAQFLHQRAEKEAGGGIMPLSTNDNNAYAKMHKRMIALQGAKPVKSHEILVLLLRLRQVCCHCGLIAAMLDDETAGDGVQEDEAGKDLLAELNKLSLEDSRVKRKSGQQDEEHEEDGVAEEGTTVTEAIRSVLSPHNPVFQLTRHSSKIQAVMQCLKENVFANKGDKAVVVSQWTSVLRLVGDQLAKERVQCVTLSGNVPVPARPPLIQALNDPNNNVRVMLLSLCAGGVGLNLCGANHLLLLDPHWNPQLEEQAQDRIYRVGQHKHVHIYRFMCVGTVEQSIRTLQQAKLELANNVLTGARNNNASKLTIEDLKLLFNMGE